MTYSIHTRKRILAVGISTTFGLRKNVLFYFGNEKLNDKAMLEIPITINIIQTLLELTDKEKCKREN